MDTAGLVNHMFFFGGGWFQPSGWHGSYLSCSGCRSEFSNGCASRTGISCLMTTGPSRWGHHLTCTASRCGAGCCEHLTLGWPQPMALPSETRVLFVAKMHLQISVNNLYDFPSQVDQDMRIFGWEQVLMRGYIACCGGSLRLALIDFRLSYSI